MSSNQSSLFAAKALASETGILAKSYARVSKAQGEHFNIFTILNMEADEVRTHSGFLAELLNPKGRHGMDAAFLKLFLEKFEIKDFKAEDAQVYIEYHVGQVTAEHGGRIDILLKSGNRYIVIENKIYATEQKNQLLRYHHAFRGQNLFFLTLDGKQSDEHEELDKRKISYSPISYGEDILEWLNDCLKEAATIPVVRETIGQYINLIKKLTGQNINQQMTKEIVDSILTDDQRYEGFAALMGAAKEVRNTLLSNRLIPLLYEIAEEINRIEKDENKKLQVLVDEKKLLNYRQSWKDFAFINSFASDRGVLKLKFEFAVGNGYSNLVYGITINSSHFDPGEEIKIRTKLIDNFKSIFQSTPSPQRNGWVMKHSFDGYVNWDNWETLGKIRTEEFKQELKDKVVKLKECVEGV